MSGKSGERRALYLVDVSSMFFRAFYAIRPLSSPSGMPVNAIYGFLTMTTKLLREIRPDYIAFCFDRPEPSFRKDMDERYKANRTEMPEDLVPQIPWIRKVSEGLGIACFDRLGFEADDLIGTLSKVGHEQGVDVVIVSGDKDFGQLVKPGITLYDTMKEIRYDSAAVLEKWGVEPSKMIDYLALVGDSSDNVKGVAGIGPKGAQKLLLTFDSIEDIYKKIDTVTPEGTKKKLIEGKEEAFLAKRLVTIAQDVPLDTDLEKMKIRTTDRADLSAMLLELGFKTLHRQLLGSADAVTSDAAAGNATGDIAASTVLATQEAVAASPLTSEPLSGSARLTPGPFWKEESIDIKALGAKLRDRSPDEEIWLIHSERGLFAGVNWPSGGIAYQLSGDPNDLAEAVKGRRLAGYDLKDFAHRYSLGHFHVAWDARLAAYVEHAGSIESVYDLFTKYLGITLPDLAGASQWLGWNFALRRELEHRLRQQNGVKVLHDLDLPLVPVLYRMEKKGILIDRDMLGAYSKELAGEIQSFEAAIHKEVGEVFNVGSPKQLGQILFGKMGLPSGKKTKTGFSTDNEVLEGLEHPIGKMIINWREVSKLKSTYVDALPQLADGEGRVHTTFDQAMTMTGRLSSINPNLQNIPIRTERGQRIRKAFVAANGRDLLSADYSQIELRVLAHITEDPGLVRAFENGHDIHTATASEVFEVKIADVTPEMRRQAKAVNFGLAYGQGAFGLADALGVSRKDAQKIIDRYFTQFARVRDYMTSTVEVAKEKGYVETVFGRRRYLEELKSGNGALRKFGERAAINAPIQGAAADLVKKAMIDVDRALDGKSGVDMLLQVHDELVFEVDAQAVNGDIEKSDLVRSVRSAMESVVAFRVPLIANVGVGHNWQDAH